MLRERSITLLTALLDHPDGTNGYRLEYGGRVFALLCDTEGFPGKRDAEMVSLARHADLALYDSTFTESEIVSKAGWGHSTWMRGVRLANEAEVKHLCLFHRDPSHDDDFMDKLVAEATDVRARRGQRARLSICDEIVRRGRNCPRAVLVERKQWPIVSASSASGMAIVQVAQDVTLHVANCDDGVPRFTFFHLARQ